MAFYKPECPISTVFGGFIHAMWISHTASNFQLYYIYIVVILQGGQLVVLQCVLNTLFYEEKFQCVLLAN